MITCAAGARPQFFKAGPGRPASSASPARASCRVPHLALTRILRPLHPQHRGRGVIAHTRRRRSRTPGLTVAVPRSAQQRRRWYTTRRTPPHASRAPPPNTSSRQPRLFCNVPLRPQLHVFQHGMGASLAAHARAACRQRVSIAIAVNRPPTPRLQSRVQRGSSQPPPPPWPREQV